MKIVIDIPEETYKSIIESDIEVEFYQSTDVLCNNPISIMLALRTGKVLPKGAEILTKEAYSDLCLRASQERKTGRWIVESDCEGKTRTIVCPFCGWKHGKYIWTNDNFCGGCGAKMEGAEE